MLDKLICKENISLFEAIKGIDKNAKGILFVTDDNLTLKGIVTDGDIRRAIINNVDLSSDVSSVMTKNFAFGTVEDSQEILTKKINEKIRILPILDKSNKIVNFFQYDKRVHLPISTPSLKGNEFNYLLDAFLSTWISSSGEYIKKFEHCFSSYVGCKYGVSTSNGTTAIHLALEALNIGQGDEVIVPNLTFAASINAVLHAQARPVLVDVDKNSWCISPAEIEKAITEKTKAILVVHLYGQSADIEPIMKIAKKYNLKIIEDCAEAHGAEYKGKKIGSFGDINCFSFFANKILTTGEGGMCLTNDSKLDEKMRILRDHGMSLNKKYWHDFVGYNYRMTNLQAAIGLAQTERINEMLSFRDNLEEKYKNTLSNLGGINFQQNIINCKKVVWLVCILFEDNSKRDKILASLKENKIDGRPFFYPLSEMPIYRDYAKFSYHNSIEISQKGINLPTNLDVTDENIQTIYSVIKKALQ